MIAHLWQHMTPEVLAIMAIGIVIGFIMGLK